MVVVAGLWLGLLAAGCDNAIEPLAPGSERNLILYGFLDSAADTQFVRIDEVQTTAFSESSGLEDVRVTLSDGVGGQMVWNHRPAFLDDGKRTDLFWSVFKPLPGQRYLLRAEHPSGFTTTATVTIPAEPLILPDTPMGDTLNLIQNIRVNGLDREPHRFTLLYDVQPPELPNAVRIPVDYGRVGQATRSGWAFDVFLKRDQATVLTRIERNIEDRDVRLVSIGVRAELLSEEWDRPDDALNITQGRGFFGAIGRYDLLWSLEPDVVHTMGFVDGQ